MNVIDPRLSRLEAVLREILDPLYRCCLDDAACDTQDSLKVYEQKKKFGSEDPKKSILRQSQDKIRERVEKAKEQENPATHVLNLGETFIKLFEAYESHMNGAIIDEDVNYWYNKLKENYKEKDREATVSRTIENKNKGGKNDKNL